ncbi:hypothetical protein VU07_03160, partial [Desulfobulbus sp. F4]|nr:hypothetical protein [Desulfobulbus sp. F4]
MSCGYCDLGKGMGSGNVGCGVTSGGGIDAHNSTVRLNNSTISGNSADKGGGIYNYGGAVVLTSSIVSGNLAHCYGAGAEIFAIDENDEEIPIDNNQLIVYGNSAAPNKDSRTTNTHADNYNLFGHNGETNAHAFDGFTPGTKDITATSDGTKPTALDTILSPLANNGGL